MSIQNNFPALKPTLLLDFANTKELDPRITFTRASTATYYGTQSAKAEENLLTYSQELDNADWTKTNSTVTANATTAPDSTTTAEKVVSNASATDGRVSQSKNVSGSVVFSVFAKASEWGLVLLGPVGTTVGVYFNLSTGVVGTQSAGYVGTITSVGSGWYRCSVAYTGSGTSQTVRIYPTNADGSISTGNGTSGIFLWGAQLEQRSEATAYTATTTQPITNYIPQLLTAASGVARFDHNPVTGESLGLLIEESRTNLLTYSSAFDNAAWPKVNSSITANTIVAPDGALTGDKLVEDTTASSTHLITQSISFTSGTAYTYSIFAKQAEAGRYIQLSVPSAAFTSTLRGTFDLTNGTFQASASATAAITSVGNGWYKCSITATATATASGSLGIFIANSSAATLGAVTYTGNGYSGIYIWGAQLEAGAFATSYIPTGASQVTRAADAASMTGTNFSSWYNQAEGAFFSSIVLSQPPAVLAGLGIYAASDGTSSNRVFVNFGSGSNGNINAAVSTGGVLQAQTINAGLSTAGAYLYANSYKVNDFASVVNNGVAVTDTIGTIPVVDRLYLGAGPTGTLYFNSTIKKIAYYPIRVTNAQLQGLTT